MALEFSVHAGWLHCLWTKVKWTQDHGEEARAEQFILGEPGSQGDKTPNDMPLFSWFFHIDPHPQSFHHLLIMFSDHKSVNGSICWLDQRTHGSFTAQCFYPAAENQGFNTSAFGGRCLMWNTNRWDYALGLKNNHILNSQTHIYMKLHLQK